MRWLLLLIPITAYAANGDETVSGIGFLILSAATLIYRYKRYIDMNDKIESALSLKQSIMMLFAGGVTTLTATNVISLFGMVLTAVGLVFVFLNWRVNVKNSKVNERERKRANDLKERELRLKELEVVPSRECSSPSEDRTIN